MHFWFYKRLYAKAVEKVKLNKNAKKKKKVLLNPKIFTSRILSQWKKLERGYSAWRETTQIMKKRVLAFQLSGLIVWATYKSLCFLLIQFLPFHLLPLYHLVRLKHIMNCKKLNGQVKRTLISMEGQYVLYWIPMIRRVLEVQNPYRSYPSKCHLHTHTYTRY